MPTTWPALPDTLLPDHAYGLLQVRENGRLRDSLLARVNLATGVVTPETYLSRTAYDWGYDDITFRAYKSTHVVALEEGERADFVVDEDFIPAVREAWAASVAKRLASSLPKAKAAPKGPRL